MLYMDSIAFFLWIGTNFSLVVQTDFVSLKFFMLFISSKETSVNTEQLIWPCGHISCFGPACTNKINAQLIMVFRSQPKLAWLTTAWKIWTNMKKACLKNVSKNARFSFRTEKEIFKKCFVHLIWVILTSTQLPGLRKKNIYIYIFNKTTISLTIFILQYNLSNTLVSNCIQAILVKKAIFCTPALVCPITGGIQGRVVCSPRQPDLGWQSCPQHWAGFGTRWSLKSLPT